MIENKENQNNKLFMLDYLKRICPAEKTSTEKEELKDIDNKLKTLETCVVCHKSHKSMKYSFCCLIECGEHEFCKTCDK